MKKTMFLAGLLLVALLLIAGCGGRKQTQVESAFIGGTEGVKASFEPLSIKEEGIYSIFDSEDFPLELLMKNKGEENVPAGKLTAKLLGPQQNLFSGIPQWELSNANEIQKISEFNPEGGEEVVSFATDARYTGDVTGFTDITWNMEYWYDYRTHVIVNDVCFKGDLTDPKVCNVKEPKTFSVSGAPITVAAVEEDSAGRGVMLLKITVNNAGTGQATIPGQEFDQRFSQIRYSVDEPGSWECKSGGRENEARLVGGTAQVICRLKTPLAEDDLYTKQIRLTLEYVYKELLQEKLRIKESAR